MELNDTTQGDDRPAIEPVGDAAVRPLHERMAERVAEFEIAADEAPEPLPDHDTETGEVLRDEEPEARTGEIMEPQRQAGYALDRNLIPAAAETGGQFLDLLEDGQFSADVAAKMRLLAKDMRELAMLSGNKQKGQVVITIGLECEDKTFRIESSVKVTPPRIRRPRSTLFVDEHDRFTRFPPGQHQMFGVRQPGGGGDIRRV